MLARFFKDSSINFELRAWTDQFSIFAQIRSYLHSAFYDAMNAAGMSFPFPQRELGLLHDSEAEASEASQQKNKSCRIELSAMNIIVGNFGNFAGFGQVITSKQVA